MKEIFKDKHTKNDICFFCMVNLQTDLSYLDEEKWPTIMKEARSLAFVEERYNSGCVSVVRVCRERDS